MGDVDARNHALSPFAQRSIVLTWSEKQHMNLTGIDLDQPELQSPLEPRLKPGLFQSPAVDLSSHGAVAVVLVAALSKASTHYSRSVRKLEPSPMKRHSAVSPYLILICACRLINRNYGLAISQSC